MGTVRIELILDDERNFAPDRRLVITGNSGDREVEVEFFRRQHGRCIVKFRAIDSITEAEKIVGSEIRIRKRDLLAPASGSFYSFHLKGCSVFDNGEFIGVITDVLDNAGVDILKVDRGEEEILIPFAQSYLKQIDLDRRRVDVALPDGLRDINK
jgi:16S rRNA processing protein RimM